MSSRIASMKFMQRKEESTQREKLELLRKQQEQQAQWTTSEKTPSKSSKKPRFEEVGETTNSKSATLYSDKTVLNNTVPARKTEISQREVVEFRDEISKLRMGRRTFGGFNPVLEKVAKELGAEKRSGESLVDGVNLEEAALVLSNNMRARKQREQEKEERENNKYKQSQKQNKVKDTPKTLPPATNSSKQPKLSQSGRFMTADSDSEDDSGDRSRGKQVQHKTSQSDNKKRKMKE